MASLTDPLVQQLLKSNRVASLATHNPDGSIHVVAVWYHFDGQHIHVATASRSRKGRNLQANPGVSLMIDSRDPDASYGATITGTARFLTGEASRARNAEVHARYLSPVALADPRVGAVFAAWDDVTLEITPASVISWDMREADRQVFGGAFASNPGYLLPLER